MALKNKSNVIIELRKSLDRGHANHGWLNSYHTFSFASYYDPKFSSFHSLRVINEDRVKGGEGFPSHPHREFEIFSYILSGSLRHRDSLGNLEVLNRGDVQFTSAGTGITHSEFNDQQDPNKIVHFLQIWVKPNKSNLKPNYQTKHFSDQSKHNNLVKIISPTEDKESESDNSTIKINADIKVFAGILDNKKSLNYTIKPGRDIYIHLVQDAKGFESEKNGNGLSVREKISEASQSPQEAQAEAQAEVILKAGDGAFIKNSNTSSDVSIEITGNPLDGSSSSEFILFDVLKQSTPQNDSGYDSD